MKPLLIADTFHSIQGEGKFTGVPSNFVRTSSCPSRCVWCDTPYTSWRTEGKLTQPEVVLEETLANHCHHVVITGGEPLVWREQVAWLTTKLRQAGRVVTIETAGNIFAPEVEPDLWSVSPKLASSAPPEGPERTRHIASLHPECTPAFLPQAEGDPDVQYKFVVVTEVDLAEILHFADTYALPCNKIWLMPEGVTRDAILQKAEWVVELCKANGFNLSIRLHALLWGAKRGV